MLNFLVQLFPFAACSRNLMTFFLLLQNKELDQEADWTLTMVALELLPTCVATRSVASLQVSGSSQLPCHPQQSATLERKSNSFFTAVRQGVETE